MLPDHDVFITDWHNARDVALVHGPFGLDEYIEHLIEFLRAMGPGAHVVAVCQPCVPALAAAALMAEDDDAALPRSLTLMAGPIDARINPTIVNDLAAGRARSSGSSATSSAIVPPRFAGAGRRVYPGFVQVAAFMRMNPERHRAAFRRLYDDIVAGNDERAGATKAFYDEYFAVLDLTAEFYLETVGAIFQDHLLARGRLDVARPPGRSRRDHPDRAAHGRGRARRHLRRRPDRRRPRPLHRPRAAPPPPSPPGRRRALRRLQRRRAGSARSTPRSAATS